MKSKIIIIVALSVWMSASVGFSLGRDGHKIVGAIAASYLSAEAEAGIKELLGDETLADVSTWADEIRRQEAYRWTAPMHYVNVPRGATSVELDRDCAEGICVVAAITRFTAVLRDADAPRKDRIEALKFVVHFTGDVHQPMHASYAEDRGGNTVSIQWLGKTNTNLHGLWDSGMINHRLGSDWIALALQIRSSITDEQFAKWSAADDSTDWANESLAITIKVYARLSENHDIGQEDYERDMPILEDRLAAAGVRLAHLLNQSF